MSSGNERSPVGEKLVHAYNRMLERLKAFLEEEPGGPQRPALQRGIDTAKERAVQLGELSRDEAERIGYFLKRDVEDASRYLADTGHELSDWLQLDVNLIEGQLLDWFASAADRTRLDWLQFQAELQRAAEYHTGEIAGPGALVCSACGETLHFPATRHIPPCPKCRRTVFRRPASQGGGGH